LERAQREVRLVPGQQDRIAWGERDPRHQVIADPSEVKDNLLSLKEEPFSYVLLQAILSRWFFKNGIRMNFNLPNSIFEREKVQIYRNTALRTRPSHKNDMKNKDIFFSRRIHCLVIFFLKYATEKW
jgi:hypothetical protein